MVANNFQNSELKFLAWLALFASHDVGVVFGYVYLLKGRILGFHRARIYSSIGCMAILMTYMGWKQLFPVGLNAGLLLSFMAALAVLLAFGTWLFELGSAHAQLRIESVRTRAVSDPESPHGHV
jgi:hypothetical protein